MKYEPPTQQRRAENDHLRYLAKMKPAKNPACWRCSAWSTYPNEASPKIGFCIVFDRNKRRHDGRTCEVYSLNKKLKTNP